MKVLSSRISILSKFLKYVLWRADFKTRVIVYLKFSAVRRVPSENLTPFLRWNFALLGVTFTHFVASQGFFAPVPVSA